jgi:hypothetical protein
MQKPCSVLDNPKAKFNLKMIPTQYPTNQALTNVNKIDKTIIVFYGLNLENKWAKSSRFNQKEE